MEAPANVADPHAASESNRPVPLLDVQRGNRPLLDEIQQAISQVCDSGRFLHGPEVTQLEQSVAEYTGAAHAIGCASGSDALLLALMARGIGRGDEVICPSFTFFATASAVWRLGAKPVFVDIDPVTFNIDASQVEAALTPSTRAIIPVHLFGQCADMEAILALAGTHGLFVLEDAAQAIGAGYGAAKAGAIGDVGAFSFYPTKNLGGFGDGGMVTTNDDRMAQVLRIMAAHGMQPRYFHPVVGINSRLDSIQAAVLNVKFARLNGWTTDRRTNAGRYDELLADAKLDQNLVLPQTARGCWHVWNQYTIRVPEGRRDALRRHLADAQIGSEVYYPQPLHQQDCFRHLGYREGDLPETERAAAEVLSLPIFPELTIEEQQTVVKRIATFYAGKQYAAA
ncbi:DegT/DnrJ/EryC1/StrS family aminotransferase [Lignipirellula cremea]|nr:DegT/DnrJ/EryC1/StrS family aminotransferase [Lignipirellula cremea]